MFENSNLGEISYCQSSPYRSIGHSRSTRRTILKYYLEFVYLEEVWKLNIIPCGFNYQRFNFLLGTNYGRVVGRFNLKTVGGWSTNFRFRTETAKMRRVGFGFGFETPKIWRYVFSFVLLLAYSRGNNLKRDYKAKIFRHCNII